MSDILDKNNRDGIISDDANNANIANNTNIINDAAPAVVKDNVINDNNSTNVNNDANVNIIDDNIKEKDIGNESENKRDSECDSDHADELEEKFTVALDLVENRKWIELRRTLTSWMPVEVADFINRLDDMDRVLVIRFLPREFSAEVFAELSSAIQDGVLTALPNSEVRHILANLDPDDRAALMDEMPADMTRRLLNLLTPQDLKQTRELLGYPENTVGRMMSPNIVYIRERWTVREAIEYIRNFGHDSETINVVYVTDNSGTLIDDMTLSRLVLAPPDDKVSTIMDYNFVALEAFDTQESAVEKIKKYNYYALPVVDSAGALLGVVTIDDLIDVADTHATEDFQKIGAISVESEGAPIENLRHASTFLLYRRRIMWLLILVFVGIFSGAGMTFFEDIIAEKTVLVFFLTLLIGCGGNAGSQSATLMIRALATGDVKSKDWGKMIFKELAVSCSLGGTMALAVGVLGIFRGSFAEGVFNLADGLTLAAIVGLSMFVIVLVGSLIGMSMPFILSKFKRDPAAASTPLVASIADIVGVLIYFSIASIIL